MKKSRQRLKHLNNFGLFKLVQTNGNFLVLGNKFDASLDEIETYIQSEN